MCFWKKGLVHKAAWKVHGLPCDTKVKLKRYTESAQNDKCLEKTSFIDLQ